MASLAESFDDQHPDQDHLIVGEVKTLDYLVPGIARHVAM
jgi:hypothetical protein